MAFKYAKLWSEDYDWHDVLREPRDRMFFDVVAEWFDNVRALWDKNKAAEVRARGSCARRVPPVRRTRCRAGPRRQLPPARRGSARDGAEPGGSSGGELPRRHPALGRHAVEARQVDCG